jgi:hypothetical protein
MSWQKNDETEWPLSRKISAVLCALAAGVLAYGCWGNLLIAGLSVGAGFLLVGMITDPNMGKSKIQLRSTSLKRNG